MADISNNTFWSQTDSNNNSAPPNGFPEGMSPAAVNNSARVVSGAIKRFWDRINATVTSTGSSNTYAITYSVAPAQYNTGEVFSFIANHTNTGAATLNIASLGAKSIKRYDGSDVEEGDLTANGLVTVVYDGTNFQLVTHKPVQNRIEVTGYDLTMDSNGNLIPSEPGLQDLGSASSTFNAVHADTFEGTATRAQYADLAECFRADADYSEGTVLEIGGEEEITQCNHDLCDDVLGVVSTKPAYLMNSIASGAHTPAIAMAGRVPVRVVGRVQKGDRLVAAGNGVARAATLEELTAFNVIGRALEDKQTTSEGLVFSVVLLNR